MLIRIRVADAKHLLLRGVQIVAQGHENLPLAVEAVNFTPALDCCIQSFCTKPHKKKTLKTDLLQCMCMAMKGHRATSIVATLINLNGGYGRVEGRQLPPHCMLEAVGSVAWCLAGIYVHIFW